MNVITDGNRALQQRLEDYISQNSSFPVYINLHVPYCTDDAEYPSMFSCMMDTSKQVELLPGNGIYVGEIRRTGDTIYLTTVTSYNQVSIDKGTPVGTASSGHVDKDYIASTAGKSKHIQKRTSAAKHIDLSWRLSYNIAELRLQYVFQKMSNGQWAVKVASIQYDFYHPSLSLRPRITPLVYTPPPPLAMTASKDTIAHPLPEFATTTAPDTGPDTSTQNDQDSAEEQREEVRHKFRELDVDTTRKFLERNHNWSRETRSTIRTSTTTLEEKHNRNSPRQESFERTQSLDNML